MASNDRRLEGKVALVTGASSGIGRATALALAEQGAAIAIGARRADRIAELADDLRAKGTDVLTFDLDVTDEASCRSAVAATEQHLGRVDILINAAGLMLLGQVAEADTEDWRRMVDTNALGLLYMTHAALGGMLDRGSGDLVNISSVAGRVPRAGVAVYNLTKAGVTAFTEALRQEVTQKGVRVVAVEPGDVGTELTRHITDDAARKAAEQEYSGIDVLHAEDIARMIVFIVTQPQRVAVNEVLIRPTGELVP